MIGPVVDGNFSWYTIKKYKNKELSLKEAIKRLSPNNLNDQWAFKNKQAIDLLKFEGVKYGKYR